MELTLKQGSKVYIAGPITAASTEELHTFTKAAELLREAGYVPLDPNAASAPPGLEYSDYIRFDDQMLLTADAILMLRGWQRSPGATRELQTAAFYALPIFFAQSLEGK
jgi:hypothetical protein